MKRKLIIFILTLISSSVAWAEPTAASTETNPVVLFIIYFIILLMLTVVFSLYRINRHLVKYLKGDFDKEEQKMYDKRSFWEKTFQLKPVGTDKDTMIHEAHDGIYELDNPPPPWFMFLFYGTILFGVIYFVRFQVTGKGLTQEEEYALEMEVAAEEQAARLAEADMNIDESNVVVLTEPIDLQKGAEIYNNNCKVCHNEGGKGNTGPNLTDQYWKHGGSVKDIFSTIKYGVIEKGMRSWKTDLSPKMMQQVTSYIVSLQGTNPEGAKAPEGELYVPEEEAAPADSTAEEDNSGDLTAAN
jgi:cytochrome c oxidase cbb3-type subunit 3